MGTYPGGSTTSSHTLRSISDFIPSSIANLQGFCSVCDNFVTSRYCFGMFTTGAAEAIIRFQKLHYTLFLDHLLYLLVWFECLIRSQ
jgi:hypothetical protein